jgi:hypothetical protein
MAVDLVYKVGNTSESENHSELRYSIRSAERYFKDLRHIYIIGYKPNWLECTESTQKEHKLYHIPLEDCYTHNKDANLINKLIVACTHKELSKKFLNMSDDYFFIKEMSEKDFEMPLINKKITDVIKAKLINGGKLTKWELRLQKTINLLLSKNLPGDCYETHCPQMINSELYIRILLNYDYGTDNGMCGNTLYFNTLKGSYRSVEEISLLRIENKYLILNQLVANANKFNLINFTGSAYNLIMKQYLEQAFTIKSFCEI